MNASRTVFEKFSFVGCLTGENEFCMLLTEPRLLKTLAAMLFGFETIEVIKGYPRKMVRTEPMPTETDLKNERREKDPFLIFFLSIEFIFVEHSAKSSCY